MIFKIMVDALPQIIRLEIRIIIIQVNLSCLAKINENRIPGLPVYHYVSGTEVPVIDLIIMKDPEKFLSFGHEAFITEIIWKKEALKVDSCLLEWYKTASMNCINTTFATMHPA
jgi:hypothetical protein